MYDFHENYAVDTHDAQSKKEKLWTSEFCVGEIIKNNYYIENVIHVIESKICYMNGIQNFLSE